MRATVIAELGGKLTPGSGRPKEGVWLFTALVLTAAIPVLLLGGWMAYITADQERSYARKAATEALTQVAHRIEGEFSRELQVAETLASSAALDQDNLRDFYLEATRIVAARPLWETAALTKPDQEQVLNVLRPLGAPLGPVTDAESFNAVLRTRKPVLGGLGPYQAAIGKQLVSLRVPVIRDGELRYVLTIGLLPDQIGTILGQAGLPTGWAGTVIDAKEKIVARTPDTKTARAGATTPAVQEAMARSGSNSARTQTREGIDVETVHRVLAGTDGWSVHVGVPVSELNAPVSRSLRLLFGGTAASVGLAIALGLVIAREIAQRRRMEALESAAALLDSEKRGALAIDAAELGTWRWDLSANEFSGCGRFCTLLGLAGSRSGETRWSADRIFALVEPPHRAALASFATDCLESGKSSSVEFPVQSDDRGEYWLRAAGRAEGPPNRRHVIHGVLADIDILKRAETERSHLLRRLASAQEEEQRRISRELHDQIGQTVTGLSLGLKALEQGLAKGSNGEAATEQVRWLEQLAAQIGRDIHRTASDLRPTAIDDLGIFKAIEAYVAEWQERYGIRVDIQTFGRDNSLPADVAAVLYRLVQEGLTNVLKHASASKVSIVLEKKSEGLALVLEDDGIGFDPDNVGRIASARSDVGIGSLRHEGAGCPSWWHDRRRICARKGKYDFCPDSAGSVGDRQMTPVRIALVDDHPVVLAGIRALLQGVPEVELVGEANTGATGLKAICDCSPDIAVIDLSLPDISGMELARQVSRRCPDVKIIALTVHEDRAYVHPVLEAGARGYLLKRSAGDELLRAIRAVNQGDRLSRSRDSREGSDERARTSALSGESDGGELSRREEDVLKLVAQGLQQQANRRTARGERQKRRDLQGAGVGKEGAS